MKLLVGRKERWISWLVSENWDCIAQQKLRMGGPRILGGKITYRPLASMNVPAFGRVIRESLAMYVKAFSYSSPHKMSALNPRGQRRDGETPGYKQPQRLHAPLL